MLGDGPTPGPDGSENSVDPARWPAVEPFATPTTGTRHCHLPCSCIFLGSGTRPPFRLFLPQCPKQHPQVSIQALFAFNY